MNHDSVGVRKSSAFDPLNPVRYLMFARLVTSSPSRFDLIRCSTRAACRAYCGSATTRQARDQSAKRQLVTIRAKATQHCLGPGSQRRLPTLGFARKDVRQMNLDVWNGDRRERVAHGEARMRIRAGVDYDAVRVSAQPLNGVDESALMIRLGERHVDA